MKRNVYYHLSQAKEIIVTKHKKIFQDHVKQLMKTLLNMKEDSLLDEDDIYDYLHSFSDDNLARDYIFEVKNRCVTPMDVTLYKIECEWVDYEKRSIKFSHKLKRYMNKKI